MENTADKTLISLRFPSDLLGRIDAEAKERRRSRAFIFIEKMEGAYTTTNGTKSKKAPAKKAKV